MSSEQTNFIKSLNKFKPIAEAVQLHRRDLITRINRRLREKVNKQSRDLLPAQRERRQRFLRHRLKNVMAKPRSILSSTMRFR